MPLSQLTAPLTREQALALVDAVMAREDLALAAAAHEDETTGEWLFEATCDSPPDLESFSELARLTLGGGVTFSIEPIDPDADWVAYSLDGLRPVIAGGFYVHGSHHEARPPAGLTPILIDAAQAFGTGHHETTAGCLMAIDLVLRRRPRAAPRRLLAKRPPVRRPKLHSGKKPARRPGAGTTGRALDLGTGTGVLAIALARRRRRPVIASDIDPVAVRIAADNARLNGVAPLVVPVAAAGLAHRAIARNAPYDLIVANILAGPLVELAPAIARAAAPGAAIILSGLLERQAPRVAAAYAGQRMVLRGRIVRRGWATLILERFQAKWTPVRRPETR